MQAVLERFWRHAIIAAMNLKHWIEAERGRASALAVFLGSHAEAGKKISPNMVYQWCSKDPKVKRSVPIRWCSLIEAFASGEVMRWDMRPKDWHVLWPELKRRKDAPPIRT
jgi:DNA-binding transcriptional regulator YdaS (Cro superfamily)